MSILKRPGAVEAPKEDANAAPEATTEAKPKRTRKDYGYAMNSTIQLLPKEEVKYRGLRAQMYDLLKQHDGKTVGEIKPKIEAVKSDKGTAQVAAGWIRFFVEDGACTLKRAA